jgi:hypothetical protein
MLTEAEFDRLIAKARKTNIRRDMIERDHGFASPAESPPTAFLRTVVGALEAGLRLGDNDCIAEALVMCQDMANALAKTGGADGNG